MPRNAGLRQTRAPALPIRAARAPATLPSEHRPWHGCTRQPLHRRAREAGTSRRRIEGALPTTSTLFESSPRLDLLHTESDSLHRRVARPAERPWPAAMRITSSTRVGAGLSRGSAWLMQSRAERNWSPRGARREALEGCWGVLCFGRGLWRHGLASDARRTRVGQVAIYGVPFSAEVRALSVASIGHPAP
jgi:hypothetical protein